MAAPKPSRKRTLRCRTYAPLVHRHPGHWTVWGSLLVVGGALVLPMSGTGIDTCPFKHATGLPCLACGLTRSVACLGHGEAATSFDFHPFGFLVLGIAMFCLGVQFGFPRRVRRRIAAWMTVHHPTLRRVYKALLIAFFAFGIVRTVLVGCDSWPEPVAW